MGGRFLMSEVPLHAGACAAASGGEVLSCERIFIELVTSDRKIKASREVSKRDLL